MDGSETMPDVGPASLHGGKGLGGPDLRFGNVEMRFARSTLRPGGGVHLA